MFIKVSKMLLSAAVISSFYAAPAHAIWPLSKKVTVYVSKDLQGQDYPPCTEAEVGEICRDRKARLIQLSEVKEKTVNFGNSRGDRNDYVGPLVKIKYVDVTNPRTTQKEKESVCTEKTIKKCTTTVDEETETANTTPGRPGRGGTDADSNPVLRTNTTTTTTTTTRTRYRDPRAQAQFEFDQLYDFCNGYVEDAISTSADTLKDRKDALEAANANIGNLKKAADDAYKAALIGCRKDCLQIAIAPAKFNLPAECAIKREEMVEMVNTKDFKAQPGSDRANLESQRAMQEFFSGQKTDQISYIQGRTAVIDGKLDNVCTRLVNSRGNPKCAAAIEKLDPPALGSCDAWLPYVDAKVAYDTAVKDQKKLAADVDKLQRGGGNCVIHSANDLAVIKNSGPDCLQKASDSCPKALADANQQLQIILRTPYCATCGYGDGNGGGNANCQYGVGCGVSKAAQMITAIGGVAVPLGLGVMNLAMWNKGVNACTSMYGQTLDVSRAVGLPPPAPSCGGLMGYGAGFNGMAGMSGFPGMGFPGVGIGGGIYGGMGMPGMYNPFGGISGGINAGINFGMGNPMMMGGGYNPMMMGGGYNPMLMGQMGGGYNPMMGMQNNAYGMQQQMMADQMRMQQMAAQNMVLQQSSMMGGMYGQMGGAYGMQMSPYYNMGYSGGVNPMLNMGVTGNFTMNPWAYAGGGGGYYNPMMYGGANAGVSGGISAGINAGFNTGAYSGGNYGYQQYPSMATPPFAGYNNYGYNAGAGYGPYGNTGTYPTATGNTCGWQMGTPCS